MLRIFYTVQRYVNSICMDICILRVTLRSNHTSGLAISSLHLNFLLVAGRSHCFNFPSLPYPRPHPRPRPRSFHLFWTIAPMTPPMSTTPVRDASNELPLLIGHVHYRHVSDGRERESWVQRPINRRRQNKMSDVMSKIRRKNKREEKGKRREKIKIKVDGDIPTVSFAENIYSANIHPLPYPSAQQRGSPSFRLVAH